MMQRNTLNVRCIKRIYGEAEVPPHILYQTQVVTADYSESEACMFWNKDSIFLIKLQEMDFFFFPSTVPQRDFVQRLISPLTLQLTVPACAILAQLQHSVPCLCLSPVGMNSKYHSRFTSGGIS